MGEATTGLHVICERDVGLFSLVQQVIAQVPWALAEGRTPVVLFGPRTCYWTPDGFEGRDTVWEYYFEPLVQGCPAAAIPDGVRAALRRDPPSPFEVGRRVDAHTYVSGHFGDHPDLRGRALTIPYQWDDPDDGLRRCAKAILDEFVRPRAYLRRGPTIPRRAPGGAARDRRPRPRHRRHSRAASPRLPAGFAGAGPLRRRDRRAAAVPPRRRVLVATDDQASLAPPGGDVRRRGGRLRRRPPHGGERAGEGSDGLDHAGLHRRRSRRGGPQRRRRRRRVPACSAGATTWSTTGRAWPGPFC